MQERTYISWNKGHKKYDHNYKKSWNNWNMKGIALLVKAISSDLQEEMVFKWSFDILKAKQSI